jgi:3-mercaptopyruvate sulfurtransferase SseA
MLSMNDGSRFPLGVYHVPCPDCPQLRPDNVKERKQTVRQKATLKRGKEKPVSQLIDQRNADRHATETTAIRAQQAGTISFQNRDASAPQIRRRTRRGGRRKADYVVKREGEARRKPLAN